MLNSPHARATRHLIFTTISERENLTGDARDFLSRIDTKGTE